jgi:hypothetical protein
VSPALRTFIVGPLRSYAVSQLHGLQAIAIYAVVDGYARGSFNGWGNFLPFLVSPATTFAIFMAVVFSVGPLVRAQQAQTALRNTVSLADGTTAVITKAPQKMETPAP